MSNEDDAETSRQLVEMVSQRMIRPPPIYYMRRRPTIIHVGMRADEYLLRLYVSGMQRDLSGLLDVSPVENDLFASGLDFVPFQRSTTDALRSGMSDLEITALPTWTVQQAIDSDQQQCHICLENFSSLPDELHSGQQQEQVSHEMFEVSPSTNNIEHETRLVALPCQFKSHCFHHQCIRDWLRRSAHCPVCRHLVRGHMQPSRQTQEGIVLLPYSPPVFQRQLVSYWDIMHDESELD